MSASASAAAARVKTEVKHENKQDGHGNPSRSSNKRPRDAEPNSSCSDTAKKETKSNQSIDFLLEDAEKAHRAKLEILEQAHVLRKAEMLKSLELEKKSAFDIAQQEFKQIKTSIMNSVPATDMQKCSLCADTYVVLAGACVGDGRSKCDERVCENCLYLGKDWLRCYLCEGSGQYSKTVKNMICQPCAGKRSSGYQFDFCRNDCGFLCPEHSHKLSCCVCGSPSACVSCKQRHCERCGEPLCGRCEFKEGCMCNDKSGREIMMQQMGMGGDDSDDDPY